MGKYCTLYPCQKDPATSLQAALDLRGHVCLRGSFKTGLQRLAEHRCFSRSMFNCCIRNFPSQNSMIEFLDHKSHLCQSFQVARSYGYYLGSASHSHIVYGLSDCSLLICHGVEGAIRPYLQGASKSAIPNHKSLIM